MEKRILTSTKKLLGLPEDHTEFDLDVITHINSVFSDLTQLGIGPPEGFMIEDDTLEWDDYLMGDLELNTIKSYMALRVRLLFDPPTTSYLKDALEKQIQQFEWRINVAREAVAWVDPNPRTQPDDELQELINIVDSQVI